MQTHHIHTYNTGRWIEAHLCTILNIHVQHTHTACKITIQTFTRLIRIRLGGINRGWKCIHMRKHTQNYITQDIYIICVNSGEGEDRVCCECFG